MQFHARECGLMRCAGAGTLALWLLGGPAPAQVGGSIGGLVRDEGGTAQMGAAVRLLAADGRLVQALESDYRGWFQFSGLFPGVYAIEVRQANFAPARESELAVEPGQRTFLDVSLRGMFASLQLAYGSPVRDMSERWKWVLRAKHSRRNVLRMAPGRVDERERFLRRLDGTFEDTRAYAELSAGQGNRSNGLHAQRDLGSAFAVATSLFGRHDFTVSGASAAGRPDLGGASTAFRTTYAKELGLAKPELALTVRQLQASSAAARGVLGSQHDGQGVPRLETFSLEIGDSVELTDALRVEYGMLFESVNFIHRLQFANPYGRAVYKLGEGRELAVGYASGTPPPAATRDARDETLRSNVRQLGLFPRVSAVQGRPTIQRAEHIEISYRQAFGSNMVEAAVYRDSLRDAAISATVPEGVFGDGEVVPDLYSSAATLNGGSYRAPGARLSYSRNIRDRLQAALGYGYGGVLAPTRAQLRSALAEDLRASLAAQGSHMLAASVSAELPAARTVMTGSYQWTSRESVLPADPFNDFAASSEPGLNLVVRQPLPGVAGMPGKFEASAEFRNLLKTGYVPLQIPGGQVLNLLQAIRSYSGALSYIF